MIRSLLRGGALCLLAAIGATGAAAWACVPQPLVSVQPKASGPPGSEVTVVTQAVAGPAEVRWNATDGPLLAKGIGSPNLSVKAKVPDVPEGLYTIVVVMREPGGADGSTGRAAFLVTGSQGPGGNAPEAPAGSDAKGRSEPTGTRLNPAGIVGGGAFLLVAGGAGGAWLTRRSARR